MGDMFEKISRILEEKERRIQALSDEELNKMISEPNSYPFDEVAIARELLDIRSGRSAPGEWLCLKCGLIEAQPPTFTFHCPRCNESILPSRLNGTSSYPKISEPAEINCYIVRQRTLITTKAFHQSETLYIIDQRDAVQIIGEEGNFYEVLLPGGDKGYVPMAAGIKVSMGSDDINKPLGYARLADNVIGATVSTTPSEKKTEILYTLNKEDRLPIVEEREHFFKVQLPNRIRGWIKKSAAIRTLLPDSLPPKESLGDVAISALGVVALLGIAAIGGALAGDAEQNKIKRGVDNALRERGL